MLTNDVHSGVHFMEFGVKGGQLCVRRGHVLKLARIVLCASEQEWLVMPPCYRRHTIRQRRLCTLSNIRDYSKKAHWPPYAPLRTSNPDTVSFCFVVTRRHLPITLTQNLPSDQAASLPRKLPPNLNAIADGNLRAMRTSVARSYLPISSKARGPIDATPAHRTCPSLAGD